MRLIVAFAVVLSPPAWAQTVDVRGPAELPPASYTADQYTDSRGCVFVRAGGVWAARTVPGQGQMCGLTPSLSVDLPQPTRRPQPATTSAATTAALPRQVTAPPPTVAPQPPAEPPAASAPPADDTAPPVVPADPRDPDVAAIPPADADPADVPPRTPVQTTTPAASATAAEVTPPPVPQAAPPAPRRPVATQMRTVATQVRTVATEPRTRATICDDGRPCVVQPRYPQGFARGLSRHVERNPGFFGLPIYVPPGYQLAWDDGRINPERGPRTIRGDLQMQALWTDTVPRRGARPAYVSAYAPVRH